MRIWPGIKFGLSHRQPLKDEGERQHPDAGNQPADHDRNGSSTCGHILRQAEDAGTHHSVDDEGGQQPDAKLGRGRRCRFGNGTDLGKADR